MNHHQSTERMDFTLRFVVDSAPKISSLCLNVPFDISIFVYQIESIFRISPDLLSVQE